MGLGSMQADSLEIGQNIKFFFFVLTTRYLQSYVADGSICIHNMKLDMSTTCIAFMDYWHNIYAYIATQHSSNIGIVT